MIKKILLSLSLVIIWIVAIFIFSNMTSDESNSQSHKMVDEIIEVFDKITNANEDVRAIHKTVEFKEKANYIFRKICHSSVYFGLAILVFNLLIHLFRRKLMIYNGLTILICFLYAIFDEYHQTFVMGRTGQFTDVLIDTLGILLGCGFITMIYLITKHVNFKKLMINTCI